LPKSDVKRSVIGPKCCYEPITSRLIEFQQRNGAIAYICHRVHGILLKQSNTTDWWKLHFNNNYLCIEYAFVDHNMCLLYTLIVTGCRKSHIHEDRWVSFPEDALRRIMAMTPGAQWGAMQGKGLNIPTYLNMHFIQTVWHLVTCCLHVPLFRWTNIQWLCVICLYFDVIVSCYCHLSIGQIIFDGYR